MIIILLHIMCYDIWYYISHLFLHNQRLYFIHKIHHKKLHLELNYLDSMKAHHIENIVQPLGIFFPCILYKTTITKFMVSFLFICFRAFMKHDKRASFLTGNHHLLHHNYPKYNFGEYWIDKCCGTLYPNENEYVYGKIYT